MSNRQVSGHWSDADLALAERSGEAAALSWVAGLLSLRPSVGDALRVAVEREVARLRSKQTPEMSLVVAARDKAESELEIARDQLLRFVALASGVRLTLKTLAEGRGGR